MVKNDNEVKSSILSNCNYLASCETTFDVHRVVVKKPAKVLHIRMNTG